jgi:virginiamycin B lyase
MNSSTTKHPTPVSAPMRRRRMSQGLTAGLALAAATLAAQAGGSNYGIAPGAREIAGKVAEWPVPTPQFARDPTPAPDGRIFLVAMAGNRLARFEPATEKFEEWELPANTNPHSVLVDGDGVAWLTGKGNGTIVEFHPDTGETVAHRVPSGGDPHTAALDDNGVLWFTEQAANRIGRLDRGSGAITEYQTSGTPYGLSIDHSGNVWFCRIQGDMLGRLDPRTGVITDVPMGKGSAPRRIATAPDGTLWVALWGNGRLAHVDPATAAVIREYPLPGGSDSGPYAVTVDTEGKVFVNEFNTDVVVILDPRTEAMRSIPVPKKSGIRKMVIDQAGSLWYVGSSSGRLGRID